MMDLAISALAAVTAFAGAFSASLDRPVDRGDIFAAVVAISWIITHAADRIVASNGARE
jgi:hypothetical protein